jgi:hypothetical protein
MPLLESNQNLLEGLEGTGKVNDEINEYVKTYYEEDKVIVPIAPIEDKDGLYLIGTVRMFVEIQD